MQKFLKSSQKCPTKITFMPFLRGRDSILASDFQVFFFRVSQRNFHKSLHVFVRKNTWKWEKNDNFNTHTTQMPKIEFISLNMTEIYLSWKNIYLWPFPFKGCKPLLSLWKHLLTWTDRLAYLETIWKLKNLHVACQEAGILLETLKIQTLHCKKLIIFAKPHTSPGRVPDFEVHCTATKWIASPNFWHISPQVLGEVILRFRKNSSQLNLINL